MQLRALTTIDEFLEVCALEREVWGYTTSEDAVTVPTLVASSRIGGLIIGAVEEDGRLAGFVYSMPGIRNGRPFQWSHMLGVAPACRGQGVGRQLKAEQRRLTRAMGLDLIAWTFDPLQSQNAHLNFAQLGVVAAEYHENVYGESTSPLHRGTPTDRLVAEWWIDSPRVAERMDAEAPGAAGPAFGPIDPAPVNRVKPSGEWIAPAGHDLLVHASQVGVIVPTGFTEMQLRDPGLARDWRAATREILSTYLARGYRVEEFALDRAACRGTYLLAGNPGR